MKRTLITLTLILLLASSLYAQNVILRDIQVESTKTTRSNDVLRYLEIVTDLYSNKPYTDVDALYADLDEALHRLKNTLYFGDAQYTVQAVEDTDGTLEVEVVYRLEDAWTLYPLPVVKYDSNYGMILGGLVRGHNLNGTMTDLTVGMRYNPEVWYSWLEWEYLRVGNMLWDIWIFEKFETIKRIDENNVTLVDFDYYSTELSTRTEFPLYSRLEYSLSPGVYFPYNYTVRAGESSPEIDETGLTPSLEHQLSWNGVDWIGTHRSGLMGAINHTMNYNVLQNNLQNILTLETQYFYNRNIFDAHIRGLYMRSWGNEVELLGEYVRGVGDARLWGSSAFIVNFSAGITVTDIPKVGELQVLPFCDAAFIEGREPVCSVGVQFLIFLDLFPALPNTIYWGTDTLHEGESEFKMYCGLHSEPQRFR